MFVVFKKIINSDICGMGVIRSGKDDVDDIIYDSGIDLLLEEIIGFTLFIIFRVG